MSVLPRRNPSRARRRWACDLSEWIDSAAYPASVSIFAHSSARFLVRANTITRLCPFSSRMARSSSGLRLLRMGMTYCATVLAVSPILEISTMAGSRRSDPRLSWIDSSMVAENSSVWRSAGIFSTIAVTSGRNPMSSMRSASSSTSTWTADRSTTPRSIRSIRRPGVAMRMSVPLRSSLIWGP